MHNHPRFKQLPQHDAYYKMYPTYRPFVYWINEPNYVSNVINTDSYGIRYSFLKNGKRIELINLKQDFEYCNIILGGSTVFGVDASQDNKTISSYLSHEIPCINFGNRGAVAFQELILFLQLRPLLPKIKNIILLSGVNEVSLASLEGSIIYDQFGGIFGQDNYMAYPYLMQSASCFDEYSYHRIKFYNAIERRYRRNSLFKTFLIPILKKFKITTVQNNSIDFRKSFDLKVNHVIQNLHNYLYHWRNLALGEGAEFHYFLQPAVNWNNKTLTKFEAECMEMDIKRFPSIQTYSNPAFHQSYSKRILEHCKDLEIPFYDSNDLLNTGQNDIDIFTDVCHLTDKGNERVGDYIKSKIKL